MYWIGSEITDFKNSFAIGELPNHQIAGYTVKKTNSKGTDRIDMGLYICQVKRGRIACFYIFVGLWVGEAI